MIRVLMTHVAEGEARLLGDFPPSEIDTLVELVGSHRIYWGEVDDRARLCAEADDEGGDGPLQWQLTDEVRPRVVLNIFVG